MVDPPETLGIIAGSRSLPFRLVSQARAAGVKRIIAAAFEKETDPALAGVVDEIEWLRVGQLGKLCKTFSSRGARHCVMAGQIAPKNLFDLRPDLRAMALLMRLKEKNAHTIFGAIADELGKDGVELISAVPFLEPLMPKHGFLLGPELTAAQVEDARHGFRIAKEIARLEIGQIVVVKDGTVLAVEGFEGTDRCLERGGQLAGRAGGATAVKVARAGHDMRFDIPCVGERTVRVCADAGVTALVLEAGRTLILEEDEVAALCRSRGVTITTVE
ncbi:MAG: UDP-2,3-diacylglucosamine diphosphatase LpxI [Verrucomicrobiae bacterium]|nr:UDP-2,3-diacylglucosamine diphosphatase LpxI [Verrucomicrobiae bacterium]